MSLPHSHQWFVVHILSHDPALRAWVAGRFPGLDDPEDVVQETYRRVWLACEKHEIPEPRAFLFTTARNLAIDRLRRRNLAQFEPLQEADAAVVCGEPDAAEQAIINEELEFLTTALQSLPLRCRRVLTLRKIYGLSQKEISAELGISENTVEWHLSAGMARLAASFARLGLL